jgi:hypothetical protein
LWQLKRNATDIAAAAAIQERTAQRCINLLDGGIYETYHLDPTRPLEHQVEAEECYQSAGSKGLPQEVARCERAPRQRGLQLRGRATAELGRPPLLGLVQRRDKTDQDAPAAQVYLEVLEHVRTATIKPIITAKEPVASFQDSQHCPPWPRGRPRAVVAYGAVSKVRGTLRQHVGEKAHEDCVLCSCTPEMYKPPQQAFPPHISRDYTAQQHSVVYLPNADKYRGLTRRPLQGQKGLDERALMASQRPSAPW